MLVEKTLLNALYFSGTQLAGHIWLRGLGAILMLHRVSPKAPYQGLGVNEHLRVTPDFLDRLLATYRRRRYDFVSMDEVHSRLAGHDPKVRRKPFVAVTLDDGYRDNLVHAAPVFRKHGIPFMIYVAPGLVDGKATLWWEDLERAIVSRDHMAIDTPKGPERFNLTTNELKRRAFGELLQFVTNRVDEKQQRKMIADISKQCGIDAQAHRASSIMNWREIAELARDPLCTFGAHTIHHYAVARLGEREALAEMVESARIVEMETGRRAAHFAYPYGYKAAAGPRDFALAGQAGFDTAVTTRHGVVYPAHAEHRHALPRISLNGRFQAVRYVDTLLSGLPTRLVNRGRAMNVG